MPLKTNVFIRRAEREDLDTVIEWMNEPDFLRFLYGDPTRSPKMLREKIAGMLGRTSSQIMPSAIYLIIESTENGPIGLLSLQRISWRNRSCCIDLFMAEENVRNSFMAAFSTYRALEYCFDELNLHRISAYIYSFNPRSWRLMEKTGSKREVTLNEHVARNGKLYDMYCYGLLRREFNELRDKHSAFKGAGLRDMIEFLRCKDEDMETGQ